MTSCENQQFTIHSQGLLHFTPYGKYFNHDSRNTFLPNHNSHSTKKPDHGVTKVPLAPLFSSEKRCLAFWHQTDWHTNLPRFQGARPDHVRVEISSCCFPRGLVSFIRSRELVTHDPWHVLLQSGNVFELGGITISIVIPPNSNTFSDWRRTCHVPRAIGQNSMTL